MVHDQILKKATTQNKLSLKWRMPVRHSDFKNDRNQKVTRDLIIQMNFLPSGNRLGVHVFICVTG